MLTGVSDGLQDQVTAGMLTGVSDGLQDQVTAGMLTGVSDGLPGRQINGKPGRHPVRVLLTNHPNR